MSIISRMPKLAFLDARKVDKTELLSLLQCPATHLQTESQQTTSELAEVKMEKFGSIKKLFGLSSKETRPLNDSQEAYTPLPTDNLDSSQSSHKTIYGKVKNHYEGSQSQGNRFILNQDLWNVKKIL